jgi:hypothetical protein
MDALSGTTSHSDAGSPAVRSAYAGAHVSWSRPWDRRATATWGRYPQWFSWFVMAMLLWVLLSANYRAAVTPASGMTGLDFRIFYKAAARLDHGQPLYGTDYSDAGESGFYIYTPLLADLLRPMALLPYETALRVWFFITSAALLCAIWLYTRAAGLSLKNSLPVMLLMVMSLHYWVATLDQGVGNINSILLACLCGMFLAARHDNDLGVALWIALGALLKTWMIGMLLYLVMRRAWRPLGISLTTVAVVAALLFVSLPPGQFHQFVASNIAMATQPNQVSQSFYGVSSRHLAPNPLVEPMFDSRTAFLVVNAVGGIVVGVGLFAMWEAGPRLDGYREQLRLGLIMCSMLLTMPVSHQVYHVIDLALIWALLLPLRPIRRAYTTGLIALGVYLLLTVGWPTVNPLPVQYRQGVLSLLTSVGLLLRLSLWLLGLTVLLGWSTDLRSAARQITRDADAVLPGLMDVDYACE